MKPLALLLLTSTPVLAQTTFSIGPQIGLNTSTVHFADSPTYINTFPPSYRIGFEAGVLSSLEFKHLTLQAAVLFSQKGYQVKNETIPDAKTPGTYNGSYRLNYLTLPLTIAYTTRANGQGLRFFTGPYLGVQVGGHYSGVYNIDGLAPIEGEGKILSGNKTDSRDKQPRHLFKKHRCWLTSWGRIPLSKRATTIELQPWAA